MFEVKNGIPWLSPELSKLEREVLNFAEQSLIDKGFTYLSIPSTVSNSIVESQKVVSVDYSLKYDNKSCLSGSAEQGILEYFSKFDFNKINLKKINKFVATNQCFRNEKVYSEDLFRVKEFKKVEQIYVIPTPLADIDKLTTEALKNATDILDHFKLEWRFVDCSADPGEHRSKFDIQVNTKSHGWIETHSCSLFEFPLLRRVAGFYDQCMISCTAIASPRILIPLMERL